MDVFVARSGGIAGIRLSWHVKVDDQPDADDWFLLIEEIPWNDVPPAPAEPDRFTWDIRCEPAEPQAPGQQASEQQASEQQASEQQASEQQASEPQATEPPAPLPPAPLQKAAEATLAERQLTGPWRELVDRVREATEPQREAPRAPRAR
jgi:hypothetical protein